MNRKIIASALAFCMLGLPVTGELPVLQEAVISAHAEEGDCYSFDAETGALTLHGNVTKEALDALDKSAVLSITAETGTVLPESCKELFSGFEQAVSIDLSGADTSQVTNMSNMFYGCSGLTDLDVSGFDTSNVTDMGLMFCGCSGVQGLVIRGF